MSGRARHGVRCGGEAGLDVGEWLIVLLEETQLTQEGVLLVLVGVILLLLFHLNLLICQHHVGGDLKPQT